jgi:hypothetical protein
MTEVNKTAAQIKTLLADLKTLNANIDKQVQFLNDLPKAPNGVFV